MLTLRYRRITYSKGEDTKISYNSTLVRLVLAHLLKNSALILILVVQIFGFLLLNVRPVVVLIVDLMLASQALMNTWVTKLGLCVMVMDLAFMGLLQKILFIWALSPIPRN